ncbi:aldose epimerase family protein [Deinococcus roseus]|uniref:Aldose 1-epimerase n=1 Tax=Deinococcus roseus TaxID=392414 RepID=A0ABQ2DA08_9DEIO|nr:aldose 1-epimerase [Deinococcus roseus]GGJ51195.1 aldose 1-epimerase [Deinococcus roseus]
MELHTISNGQLRLQVHERLGASIAAFQFRIGGTWHPIMREAADEALSGNISSPLSSYTLVPFSNRIPDGKFTFKGKAYQLMTNTKQHTTIHGDVRNRPHRLQEATSSKLVFSFDSRDHEDLEAFNYPFPLILKTTFEIEGNTLTQTLNIHNVGEEEMPIGFGIHPYFVRSFAGSGDAVLQFKVDGVYQTDSSNIPTEGKHPLPADLDFSEGKAIGDRQFDTVFGGFDGNLQIQYPETPYSLSIQADPVFQHLIVFTAPDGTLALEPVTNCTNAFNLHEQGVQGTGFLSVKAGASISGSIRFTLKS